MIKPYFETKLGKIYNCDCLDFMKDMEDDSVDLLVTSPPYNMGGGKSLGYQPNSIVGQSFYGEYKDNKDEKEYIQWCLDVIKNGLLKSRYVFWNMQYVRSSRNCIYDIQNQFRGNLKDIFIWKKQAVSSITGSKGGLAKGWEFVFMLGENDLSTFIYNDFPKNSYVPNIQTWYKKESFKEHHATFPQSLPKYFIQYFCKKGDIVLDTFLGSGTTAVACENLKRQWIGIEISEKYCEIAAKRISLEASQGKLW